MNQLLLLDDDEAVGAEVANQLTRAGFSIIWHKRPQVMSADELSKFRVVILDLMFPDIHGLDVLKDIRSVSDVPVLVLSGRQGTGDRVRALRLGADDFLTKPFWPEELLERLLARMRRPNVQQGTSLQVGALDVDGGKRRATYDGRPLNLTQVEFDLLFSLAKRKGQAISREWICSHVLDPDREANTRTLDVHVSRLRRKLGVDALIETVWGIGYRFRDEATE